MCIVRILLGRRANVSIASKEGTTALHVSAKNGYLAVIIDLVVAGADLEARESCHGATPLHLAAQEGHSEVVEALIGAGANKDCRSRDGSTPLCIAALHGRSDAVKQLLRAKASPLLAATGSHGSTDIVPLVMAVHRGHSEVVREFIQVGIKCCGSESDGLLALVFAAMSRCVDIIVS